MNTIKYCALDCSISVHLCLLVSWKGYYIVPSFNPTKALDLCPSSIILDSEHICICFMLLTFSQHIYWQGFSEKFMNFLYRRLPQTFFKPTPIHFCLNHTRIIPDYVTKQNDINTQKCTDWQLSQFDSSDATLHKKHQFYSLHTTCVLTEIQTTCIMQFL